MSRLTDLLGMTITCVLTGVVKLRTQSCTWSYGKGYGITCTPQPLYNMVRYNTVLCIIRFKDGSQKCIDYIEK